jgi:hypothetical protein
VQCVATRQTDAPLSSADVVLRPQTGEHEKRDLRGLRRLHRSPDEVLLGRLAEAVVERRAAEAVAVRDLDDGYAGLVERADDRNDLLLGELVPLRVRAVAQRGVGDPDVEGV